MRFDFKKDSNDVTLQSQFLVFSRKISLCKNNSISKKVCLKTKF